MGKKGATATKIPEKTPESHNYCVVMKVNENLVCIFVRAEEMKRHTFEACDFFQSGELVAHFNDVFYAIRITNRGDGLPDMHNFSKTLEECKQTCSPDQLPKNWGQVNGMVF